MWMEILIWVLRVSLVLVCLFMGLIILMQRSKQEGLGAAFGSGMTESVFGAQTTNVLSKLTVWCAAIFFILTLSLSAIANHRMQESGLKRALSKLSAAAPTSTATAPASAASVVVSTNQAGPAQGLSPTNQTPVESTKPAAPVTPPVSSKP